MYGSRESEVHHDQAFAKAGKPHGGAKPWPPGEAVGRAAEGYSGSLGRRGIAAKN